MDSNADLATQIVYICALINMCIGVLFYVSLGLGFVCENSLVSSRVERALVRANWV